MGQGQRGQVLTLVCELHILPTLNFIMSNKSSSHQHGLVGFVRPKNKLRKRKNKANAKARKAAIIATRAKA